MQGEIGKIIYFKNGLQCDLLNFVSGIEELKKNQKMKNKISNKLLNK